MAEVQDPRQTAIVDALLRAVARGGLSAVSIRVVAAEAGCSVGLVQRLLGTREALVAAGMRRIIERLDARLAAAGLDESVPARAFLERLTALLLDGGHHEDGLIWAAFSAQALVDPGLAAQLRQQEDEAQAAFALLLGAAAAAGELAGGADPDVEALTLLALVNGLGAQVLLGRAEPADARRAVHAHLARLFGDAA